MSRPMKASTQVKETLAAPLPHYLNFTRARGAYPSVPAPMRSCGQRSWAPQARPVRHDLGMASPHPRAEPFRAALDIETLGDLALRLGTARLAPGTGRTWERGVPGAWLAGLITDWRAFDPLILQARLDRLNHLRADIDGVTVHLAERYFRVAGWAEHDRGGHFPAVAEPGLLADRLREVF